MKLALLLAGTALTLSACTTVPGECDPSNSDVSIVTKMRCDGSGGYRKVIDDREVDLVQAREENAMFRQIFDDIQAQRVAGSKTLAEQKSRQAAVVASTQKLLTQLKSKPSKSAELGKQLAKAESDLNALQAQPPRANAGDKEKEAKQAQLQALQQTVLRLQTSLGYAK